MSDTHMELEHVRRRMLLHQAQQLYRYQLRIVWCIVGAAVVVTAGVVTKAGGLW